MPACVEPNTSARRPAPTAGPANHGQALPAVLAKCQHRRVLIPARRSPIPADRPARTPLHRHPAPIPDRCPRTPIRDRFDDELRCSPIWLMRLVGR